MFFFFGIKVYYVYKKVLKSSISNLFLNKKVNVQDILLNLMLQKEHFGLCNHIYFKIISFLFQISGERKKCYQEQFGNYFNGRDDECCVIFLKNCLLSHENVIFATL